MLSLLFVVGLARTTLPLYGISNRKRGSVLNFWLKILSILASFQTLHNVDVGPALGFWIFLPEFETIRITVKRFAIISVLISNPLFLPRFRDGSIWLTGNLQMSNFSSYFYADFGR